MDNLSIIENDIKYAYDLLDYHYLPYFSLEAIANAHICEIGPGKNLGVCLFFKSMGAEKVYAIDKYPTAWDDEYHPAFYSQFADFILKKFPQAKKEVFDQFIASKGKILEGFYPLEEDAELLPSIADKSIDFICSWAVLEHLYDPATAFARFSEITKKGGKGVHQVDFRDHHDFARPLEFLLHSFRINEELSKEAYDFIARRLNRPDAHQLGSYGLIRRQCGFWGNSFRPKEYDALWQENGFSIVDFDANSCAEDDYLEEFIPRLRKADTLYKMFSKEDLCVVGGLYKVQMS